jgi:hypothetical protein
VSDGEFVANLCVLQDPGECARLILCAGDNGGYGFELCCVADSFFIQYLVVVGRGFRCEVCWLV